MELLLRSSLYGYSSHRGVEGRSVLGCGEAVTEGADDVRDALLVDVQTDPEGLHLIGGVVVTQRAQVPRQWDLHKNSFK